jgi:hypothetical protein
MDETLVKPSDALKRSKVKSKIEIENPTLAIILITVAQSSGECLAESFG